MHIDNFNCERLQLKQCYTILNRNRNRYNIICFIYLTILRVWYRK